jgi:hypothetical protein
VPPSPLDRVHLGRVVGPSGGAIGITADEHFRAGTLAAATPTMGEPGADPGLETIPVRVLPTGPGVVAWAPWTGHNQSALASARLGAYGGTLARATIGS